MIRVDDNSIPWAGLIAYCFDTIRVVYILCGWFRIKSLGTGTIGAINLVYALAVEEVDLFHDTSARKVYIIS